MSAAEIDLGYWYLSPIDRRRARVSWQEADGRLYAELPDGRRIVFGTFSSGEIESLRRAWPTADSDTLTFVQEWAWFVRGARNGGEVVGR